MTEVVSELVRRALNFKLKTPGLENSCSSHNPPAVQPLQCPHNHHWLSRTLCQLLPLCTLMLDYNSLGLTWSISSLWGKITQVIFFHLSISILSTLSFPKSSSTPWEIHSQDLPQMIPSSLYWGYMWSTNIKKRKPLLKTIAASAHEDLLQLSTDRTYTELSLPGQGRGKTLTHPYSPLTGIPWLFYIEDCTDCGKLAVSQGLVLPKAQV